MTRGRGASPRSYATAMPPRIAVHAEPGREAAAQALADRLGLPWGGDAEVLLACGERLDLRVVGGDDRGLVGGHSVAVELTKLDTTSPAGRSRKGPLPRAAWPRRWPKPPTVLDATAGLGADAWMLARLGCRVTAVEREPVVHALLEDGLRRVAASGEPPLVAAAGRVTLVRADAAAYLRRGGLGAPPTVVMIDPMFPSGRRGVERKAMRVLRSILTLEANDADLLAAGLEAAARRVIVKRPRLAPPLEGVPPSRRVAGKAIRFDVYESQP